MGSIPVDAMVDEVKSPEPSSTAHSSSTTQQQPPSLPTATQPPLTHSPRVGTSSPKSAFQPLSPYLVPYSGPPPPHPTAKKMATVHPNTPAQQQWNQYYLPLTPNSRSGSITGMGGDIYADPFLTPGSQAANPSPPPTPSPPVPGGFDQLQRGTSLGTSNPVSTPNHLYPHPPLEGASASLRLFPQSTVYAPNQPFAAMYVNGAARPNGATATAVFPNQQSMVNLTLSQMNNPNLPPGSRKRARGADWNGSTKAEDNGDEDENEEQSMNNNASGASNLNAPPTLFNHLFVAAGGANNATTGQNPPPLPSQQMAQQAAANRVHIHTSLETIQASLDSLQAVTVSQATAAAAAQAGGNVHTNPNSRGSTSPSSHASSQHTPTTNGAFPPPLPAMAARSKTSSSSGTPTTESATPTGGKKAVAANGKGKRGKNTPEVTIPIMTPVVVSTPMMTDDGEDDVTRKSKHRLIEKQRRDELKHNMEILASLVNYSMPTNKNGTVCATISYLNQQRAELFAEREKTKQLQERIIDLEKRLHAAEVSHANCSSNLQSAENTALALVPHFTQSGPSVSLKQYQALFTQYQEIQLHYSELTQSVANMRGFLQPNPYNNANPQRKKLMSGGGPSSPHFQPQRSTSPFSFGVSPSLRAAGIDQMDESEGQGNGLSLGQSATGGDYDVFGYSSLRRGSIDQQANQPTTMPHLSSTLKRAMNPSPVDYRIDWRALFCADGTSRILSKDNIVVAVTEQFCKDLGYSAEELLGMHFDDLTPTVKQPMCRLVTQRSTHGCEAMAILNCWKTKKGGVVFRYGLMEAVWEVPKCPGSAHKKETPAACCPPAGVITTQTTNPEQSAATSGPPAPNSQYPYLEILTPSSTGGDSTSPNDSTSTSTVHPLPAPNQPCSDDKFTFPNIPPCVECGRQPMYCSFVGVPTHWTDIEHYLMLSLRTVIRAFDPEISMVGLELDEFYSRGKITYESSTLNPSGTGFITSKVTKLLPMRFVQAVQIYDQLARTAAATKTSPPRIEL